MDELRCSPDWWTMPGPSTFVQRTAKDLRKRGICVTFLPGRVPAGLKEAVRQCVSPQGCAWTEIELGVADVSRDPARSLHSRLTDKRCRTGDYVHAMLELPDFAGRLFVISVACHETWPAWRAFLNEYALIMEGYPSSRRSQFLVFVTPETEDPGFSAMDAVRGDARQAFVGLDRARMGVGAYSRVVMPYDMLFYAHQRITDLDLDLEDSLERQLLASTAASVSGYDPATCEALLMAGSLDEVLDPEKTLDELRISWQWDARTEPTWASGSRNWLADGHGVIHSAFAKDRTSRRTLVWRGQIGVLMPMLEERRRFYEERYGQYISLDELKSRHPREDDAVPEFGDMLDVVKCCNRLGDENEKYLRCLRKTRNSLAHLHIVDMNRISTVKELEGPSEFGVFGRR